jgi:hypothetical protein
MAYCIGITMHCEVLPDVPRLCLSLQIGKSHGSGFFYQRGTNVYIVTAKHVLFRMDTNFFKSERLLYHSDLIATFIHPLGTTNLHTMKIDLLEAKRLGMFFSSDRKDAAAIKWAVEPSPHSDLQFMDYVEYHRGIATNVYNLGVVNADYSPRFEEIETATDVYMVGFPSAIGLDNPQQLERNQPLFTKGIVAGKNFSNRRIIINSMAFGGNSGGPVWGRKEYGIGNANFFIIGIVVEWIDGWNKKADGQFVLQNSSYAVVEPIESVLEILP